MSLYLGRLAPLAAIGLSLLFATPASAQTTTRPKPPLRLAEPFLAKTVRLGEDVERKYALYIPPQYDQDPEHKWPVILFLHGSGECGSDGVKQTTVGLPRYIAGRPTKFPFITVMPQARTLWFREGDSIAVWAILDSVLKEYRADRDRVYITGLSMGAFATWEFIMSRPDVFAAAVPVCGVGNEAFVRNIRDVPIWAFHGALDANVPVEGSRAPIEALRKLGASPKYTEYPGLNHFCWDQAYADTSLWRWLLKQRRAPPPRVIDLLFPGRVTKAWWLTAQAADGLEEPASIRAEIDEAHHIDIETAGVVAWTILSASEPLEIGDEVEVTWNGKPFYKGAFKGVLGFRPPPASQSTSDPSTAPATRPDASR